MISSSKLGKALLSKTNEFSDKFQEMLWISGDTLTFARFGIVLWSHIASR